MAAHSSSCWGKQCFRSPSQVPKSIQILILCGLEAVQTCVKNTIFRSLKKCFSAKPQFSSSYWGKQCFRSPSQVPKFIHIFILRGLEAVQTCVKNTIFRSLKKCFSAKPQFSSSHWGKQCFRSPSQVPKSIHILILLGSSPNMCEKYNFSELEKLLFCKTSVFFKSLGKTMFQVPKSIHILILRGLDAVQTCVKNTIFRSLKKCFSAKPDFIP